MKSDIIWVKANRIKSKEKMAKMRAARKMKLLDKEV